MGQDPKAFSRVTLVAAAEVLESHSQATFNQMVVRLELENDIPANFSMSVAKKCAELARIVVRRADKPLETLEGETLPWGGCGDRGGCGCNGEIALETAGNIRKGP